MPPKKNYAKSFGTYQRHCNDKIRYVTDFIGKFKGESMTKAQQTRLEKMIEDMEDQVSRMLNSWFEVGQEALSESEEKFDDIDAANEEVKKSMEKAREAAFEFIDRKQSTNSDPASASGPPRASKIDDTLKPKEILQRSFTLEEFNVWFDRFTAYIRQN